MAESTLSLTYTNLLDAVSYFLHGKASTGLSVAQLARADEAVQSGYRQFLYPPAAEGVPPGYEWTFLRPTTTITTTANDADQDLPDDFGRLIDGFTFAAGTQFPSVRADVGEGLVRELRQQNSSTGRPHTAGIRIKSLAAPVLPATIAVGQRREVMWYPIPDAAYELSYRYESMVNKMSATYPYPLGAMKHAETIRASCIAAADLMVNDKQEAHWQKFIMQLVASIGMDSREGAKFFGNVGCRGEYENSGGRASRSYTLSVGGVKLW